MISDLINNTQYENYSETLIYNNNVGANIFRVAVMLVPLALSFIGRNCFEDDDSEKMQYRVYSNMLLLNAICYLFAGANWIFARLAMYFSVYLLLFYPLILPKIFKGKNFKISRK